MHFREATAQDRDRILALRRDCFGDVDPEKLDPKFFEWEFARGRCYVAETEDGQLAAHFAMLNVPHLLDGTIVEGGIGIDVMTAPMGRGKGTFTELARFVTAHAPHAFGTAYQIRPAVLGGILRAGWEIAEKVPILLRPAALWRGKRESFRTLTRGDILWMSGLGTGTVARTPEFLAWRFFDNPHWRYHLIGVENAGYLVARKTELKGYATYSIVDLAFRERALGRALLRDAVIEARMQGCKLAAALVSRTHPAFTLFLRRGFVPGPHRFRLIVHPPELAKRRWPVMWADTDHL
jgi:GNAT superfamily N-acetyltransferase